MPLASDIRRMVMSDWQHTTRLDYERKGFAGRSGYGRSPLLLVVDFIVGFTDPSSPLGSDFGRELQATARLQERCRRAALPIVYTTIAYASDLHDGGLFVKKVPSLAALKRGSPLTEIDARLRPVAGERTIEKKYASAFFGTSTRICAPWASTRSLWRAAPPAAVSARRRSIPCNTAIIPWW
jgi:maleamate amidohydrolase